MNNLIMKNLMKKFLFIVAVLTSIVTTAKGGELNMRVCAINAKTINLVLRNADGDIQVSIKDNKGFKLYSKNFQSLYVSKKFDLRTLETGDYIIEVKGQTKIIVMPFTVEANHVKIKSNFETIFHRPNVRLENDNVLISILANENESLEIKLYDDYANLLYFEEIVGKVNLKRTLNISKLINGEYSLVIKSGNKIFRETIKKIN